MTRGTFPALDRYVIAATSDGLELSRADRKLLVPAVSASSGP